MVTWFLPHRINGLITKFAVKAKHARTGQTVRMLEINAEDIMTGALPHCNVQYCITLSPLTVPLTAPLLWNVLFLYSFSVGIINAIEAQGWTSVFILRCLGCGWYPVSCNPESTGNNSIVPTHHPLCRAPCSLLECAHISRSWSAATLHCLSVRSVCFHLWWRGTDSLHYGPHARIRCGKRSWGGCTFWLSYSLDGY